MRLSAVLTPLAFAPLVFAGPIAYGVCQTGCNNVAVACYAAAGFTFGTIAAQDAPASIIACNSAQGSCSEACAATALIAPTHE